MIACPRCHMPQLMNTLFCDECGQEMAAAPTSDLHGPRCEFPDSHQMLTLPQRADLVPGRIDRASNTLPDVNLDPYGGHAGGVSRRHARLRYQHPYWLLEDLGSLNGTYINGKRLPPYAPTPVRSADAVRLGMLRMVFHADD